LGSGVTLDVSEDVDGMTSSSVEMLRGRKDFGWEKLTFLMDDEYEKFI
jgi:hypothetical protein